MAQFSFLMVIIPILGEALLDIIKMIKEPAGGTVSFSVLAVGFAASFIVGCAACRWMLQLVKKGKLVWFALYCAVMGIICLLWQ